MRSEELGRRCSCWNATEGLRSKECLDVIQAVNSDFPDARKKGGWGGLTDSRNTARGIRVAWIRNRGSGEGQEEAEGIILQDEN